MTWQTWTSRDLLAARVNVDRALAAKGGLADFVRMAWNEIEPTPLVWNWHLDVVCDHLMAVSHGEILRLVINVPPGTGKSSLVNVFWPAWEWTQRLGTKFIYASYDGSLVGTRDGGKVIKLLRSPWFIERWGDLLESGKQAASFFANTRGGFRYSTSVAGAVLGRHSDIQVVDDPIKPKDANGGATFSKNQIRAVSEWWSGTMATRAVDHATFRRVIVMQRLTYDDLAGEMLRTGDYVHLRLPMRYNPAKPCVTKWGGDIRVTKGELLFPGKFPEPAVTRLETKEMTPPQVAAQLQQEPQVEGGGLFKRAKFRFWHDRLGVLEPCTQGENGGICDECWNAETLFHHGAAFCELLPDAGNDIQSWDFTFDRTDTADYVAGGVIRTLLERHYLIDCVNERMDIVEAIQALKDMTQRHPKAYDKLIENKANGPAVVTLVKNSVPGVTLVEPQGSKESRAAVASLAFHPGDFFVPHPDLYPWVWPVLKQLEGFPKATYDDVVDMISQAVVTLRKHGTGFADAMRALRDRR